MSSDRRHKLAIIYPAGAAGPYRIPQFNYILKKMNGHVYFKKAFREGYPYWTAESEERTIKEMNFDYTFLKCFKINHLKICPNLMTCLLRQRLDIIVVWEAGFQTFIAVNYALLKGAKLIIGTDMTPHMSKKYKRRKFIRKWLFRRGSTFIASSQQSCKHLQSLGIDNQRIYTAPPSCNVSKWIEETNRLLKDRNNLKVKLRARKYAYVILYVGQLLPCKGLDYLLKAFYLLSREMKDIGLLIVGGGPEKERLLEYCEKNNLKEKVIFAGAVQPADIFPYYVVSDLFVLPSLRDTFGIVVTEVLASGLPVICSPFAGAHELIKNGYNGYVVNPTDTEKLSAFMKLILSDQIKN